MINIDESKIEELAVDKVAERVINTEQLYDHIYKRLDEKVDAIFVEKAELAISDAVDAAFKSGFEREFQRVNNWGEPVGEKTTIKQELEKLTSSYWNCKVDRSGKPTDSSYNSVTRAEFLMTQICAQDFSDTMRQAALSITGNLKDNLRGHIALQMDQLLDSLFKVKSLQDQGKVEKPY